MSRATQKSIIGDNTIEFSDEQTHENPDWKSRGDNVGVGGKFSQQ